MVSRIAPADKSTIGYGILTAAIGCFYMLFAFGVIHGSDASAAQGSTMIAFCVGLAFFAGGIAVVIQTIEHVVAAADGSLPDTVPTWARVAMHGLALTVTVCLAAMGLWVAFGPGPRNFTSNVPFLSHHMSEIVGRVAFGTGAVLVCFVLILVAFNAASRLFARMKARAPS